jgi:hypothetical protein
VLLGADPTEPLASQATAAIKLMNRKAYPTDLNEAEWDEIKDLLPPLSEIESSHAVDFRQMSKRLPPLDFNP